MTRIMMTMGMMILMMMMTTKTVMMLMTMMTVLMIYRPTCPKLTLLLVTLFYCFSY